MAKNQAEGLLCGMDEAGRGPLAGPLVAAAVAFPADFEFCEVFPSLKFGDSKKLTPRQREILVSYIDEFAQVIKVEVIEVEDINAQGIGWANRTIFERLIMAIDSAHYIVDGNLKLMNLGRRAARVQSMVRADESEQAVSAASIVAKVYRDRIMTALHEQYPVYGWSHNKGYGTAEHVTALHKYGA
jgi:ribonuclease HII